MKLKLARQELDTLDMTPLIDIVFQLVLFFMIASTFVEDHGLNITVPRAERPEAVAAEQAITLLVPADGALALQPGKAEYADAGAAVADLRAYAERRRAEGRRAVAVIKADRKAPYERVIEGWNAIRQAGITDVSFKVEAAQ